MDFLHKFRYFIQYGIAFIHLENMKIQFFTKFDLKTYC